MAIFAKDDSNTGDSKNGAAAGEGAMSIIAAGMTVTGDIETREAVIGGRVEGTITATERVDVQATASVIGDIHTKSIVVQEGGKINGTVKMSEAAGNVRSIEPKPQPVAVVR